MTPIEGCDYSYDPPSPPGLVKAGKKFVVRYGGVGKTGKLLTAAEAAELKTAGLAIVANVEETANAFRGQTAGVRHAAAGDSYFRARGMPADRPIYFSVDWDAGPADWPAVDAALKGAASVIGLDRVGVYGGFDTIAHCAGTGLASWFWQTYAWSGGRWHPRCHLQQYKNNVVLADGTVDLDRAVVPNYGQWGPGMTTAPASLLTARRFYIDTLAKAGFTINPLSVGIVGDDNHAKTGSSYHLGKSALRPDSYTIVESPRDKNGLTEAAAALDLGMFTITVGGKKHDLRSFSVWLVAQCKAGTPDTADIREVIYSPDGATVKRWDRLGKRTTGDNSHLSHTHESWFRDSETRDKTAHLKRYFTEIGVLEDDMPLTSTDIAAIAKAVWTYRLEDPASTTTPKATKAAADYQRWIDLVASGQADRAISAIKAVVGSGQVDQQSIITGVLSGVNLDAAAIADALVAAFPADAANRVVDALIERVRHGTEPAA